MFIEHKLLSSVSQTVFHPLMYTDRLFKRFYLFVVCVFCLFVCFERKEGREKKRERNIEM